jgi:hypothetical protein
MWSHHLHHHRFPLKRLVLLVFSVRNHGFLDRFQLEQNQLIDREMLIGQFYCVFWKENLFHLEIHPEAEKTLVYSILIGCWLFFDFCPMYLFWCLVEKYGAPGDAQICWGPRTEQSIVGMAPNFVSFIICHDGRCCLHPFSTGL